MRFWLGILGYIAAFAVLIVLWNYAWPQFRGLGPDSWRWWLRTLMIGVIITFYREMYRQYKERQRPHL